MTRLENLGDYMIGDNQQDNVNTTGTKENKFPPLPNESYTIKLNKAEIKQTKAGNGAYLNATFEVVEGEHAGRLIFEKFMIEHPSDKAVTVGKDRINKFLKSVGVQNGLNDLNGDPARVSEYVNRLLVAKLGIEEGTNGYPDRNKITSFSMR